MSLQIHTRKHPESWKEGYKICFLVIEELLKENFQRDLLELVTDIALVG